MDRETYEKIKEPMVDEISHIAHQLSTADERDQYQLIGRLYDLREAILSLGKIYRGKR